MSSPATSCSRRYTDNASTYCSRNRLITIASRNDLIPRFSVYQLGRGSDPVIVVGSTLPAVAFNIETVSSVELTKTYDQRGDRRDRREEDLLGFLCVLCDLCVVRREPTSVFVCSDSHRA